MLIVLHDFLDHVDGIVAKVHRRCYGKVDSPILGSFLDAFCDKVSCRSTHNTIQIQCKIHSCSRELRTCSEYNIILNNYPLSRL